jgi:hypothetical protein
VLDLVVANFGSGDASILLGNGPGTFGAAQNFALAASPGGVALGDIDRDGDLDAAFVQPGTQTVQVLAGDGNGSLANIASFAVHTGGVSVTLGDIDGDGALDIAAPNGDTNDVSVLRGTGTGSFSPRVDFAVHTSPQSVAIADLNRDGQLDIVAANRTSNDVSVLLQPAANVRSGRLQPRQAHAAGTAPAGVVTGDFNRDGFPDIATANGSSNNVSVLSGSSAYAAHTEYGAHTTPSGVAAGDINGDGALDLVVANRGSNDVSVLLGVGNGTFGSATNFSVHTGPRALALNDLDHDGALDIITANGTANDVSVLLGDGAGSFASVVNYATHTTPNALTLGDFDTDGNVDLATVNNGSHDLSVLLGVGDGTFAAHSDYDVVRNTPVSIVAAHSGDDPVLDLFVGVPATHELILMSGAGDGSFSLTSLSSTGHDMNFLATIDENHDGTDDIAFADTAANKVGILPMNHAGNLIGNYSKPATSHPTSVAFLDQNFDGEIDIVSSDRDANSVSVFQQDSEAPNTTLTATPPALSNSKTAVFKFSSDDPQATFVCYRDFVPGQVCTSPKSYTGLAEGSHQFIVKAVDRAGNSDLSAPSFTWTIDSVAPTTTAPVSRFTIGTAVSGGLVPITESWTGTDPSPASGINIERLERQVGAGAFSNVMLSSATATTAVVGVAPNQSNTFRTRARDLAHNTGVFSTGPTISVGLAEQTSGSVGFTGTWTQIANPNASGGSYRSSTVKDSTSTFAFSSAQSVTWIAAVGPDRGRAAVLIDGTKIATVDLYAPALAYARLVVVGNTTTSAHTLVVKVLGNHNASSTGNEVDVDAFATRS